MTESTSSLTAHEQIKRDLGRLRRDRVVTLIGYVAIIAVFLTFAFLRPTHEHALDRSTNWYIALLLMFAASVGGAAITIGVPLISQTALWSTIGVIMATLVAALLLVMDFTSSGLDDPWAAGAQCFIKCTLISGVAMLALGFLSGRLWRRFPDPGWVLALGLTGVGLSALHMQCGGSDPVHLLVFHLGPVFLLYAMARGLIWLREYVLRND